MVEKEIAFLIKTERKLCVLTGSKHRCIFFKWENGKRSESEGGEVKDRGSERERESTMSNFVKVS